MYSHTSFFVVLEGACSAVEDEDLEEEATSLFQEEEALDNDVDVEDSYLVP
jgi:hypothetical protein